MVATHKLNPDHIAAYTAKRARKLALAKLNAAATPKPVSTDYSVLICVYAAVIAATVGALLACI